MECLFDLKCHQLTKIMGYQWAGGTLKRLSNLKKLKHFGGLKRPGKLVLPTFCTNNPGRPIEISVHAHGGQDDSILSAKLIRIAPETSSF
jgi:hypothetical protein